MKIIIADDHQTFRNGLRDTLTRAGMDVVAIVNNGHEAIAAARQHLPDIIFIDIRMPGMSGVEACQKLEDLFPAMGKIAITFHDTCHADIYAMSIAGATGFLSKQSDYDEIIRCVTAVYNGAAYCDETCRLALKEQFNEDLKKLNLTEKELQLFYLISEEKTNEEIAAIMFQSVRTIEKRRKALYEKCEVKTVVGLIKCGVRWKIIEV